MEREAGLARNSNKKVAHARRRARQRAKRKQEIQWGVLPARREDGVTDLTPHVASQGIVTRGKYLEFDRGFPIRT